MSLDKSSIFAFEQDSNIRALGLRRVFNEHLTGGKKAPWTYPDNVQTIGQKNTYRATHYKNGRVRRKKNKADVSHLSQEFYPFRQRVQPCMCA